MDNVTLKEYFDTKVEAVKAVHEAYIYALEKRLESMNEFREAMKDQAARMMTREESKSIKDDIRSLRESRATLEGKASYQSVLIAYALSAISIIVSIVGVLL